MRTLPRTPRLAALALALAGCASKGGAEASSSRAPDPPSSRAEHPPAPDGTIRVGGADLALVVEANDLRVSRDELADWVQASAQSVADYYGGFPVPDLRITIKQNGRRGVGYGHHRVGRWIEIWVGSGASVSSLEDDWVLVHEMLHAAFPVLERRHKWMQEGLSTYLQRIAPAQSGRRSADYVWDRFLDAMAQGRPKPGHRGLDKTRTWGTLYWGGALFWMVADIRIREATDNQKSLKDALRGIVAAGGNARDAWSTQRVVEVGDASTGTNVLRDLYAEMALAPGDIDLDELWKRLGISRLNDGSLSYDDDAELAAIRRAMTQP